MTADLTSWPRCWFCTVADADVEIVENHTLAGVEERRSGPRFQHAHCAAARDAYEEAQAAKRAADLERMRGRLLSKTAQAPRRLGDERDTPTPASSGQHGSAAVLANFSTAPSAVGSEAAHAALAAAPIHARTGRAGRADGTATVGAGRSPSAITS